MRLHSAPIALLYLSACDCAPLAVRALVSRTRCDRAFMWIRYFNSEKDTLNFNFFLSHSFESAHIRISCKRLWIPHPYAHIIMWTFVHSRVRTNIICTTWFVCVWRRVLYEISKVCCVSAALSEFRILHVFACVCVWDICNIRHCRAGKFAHNLRNNIHPDGETGGKKRTRKHTEKKTTHQMGEIELFIHAFGWAMKLSNNRGPHIPCCLCCVSSIVCVFVNVFGK